MLSSQHAEKYRLTWTTHNLWDGCFRGGYQAAPQWIHHGRLEWLISLGTVETQGYRRETARILRIDWSWVGSQ